MRSLKIISIGSTRSVNHDLNSKTLSPRMNTDPSTVSSTAMPSPSKEVTKLSGQNASRIHSTVVPPKTPRKKNRARRNLYGTQYLQVFLNP